MKFIDSPRSKYYELGGWTEFELKLDENNWNKEQTVSVDRVGNVIGYLSCEYVRGASYINHTCGRTILWGVVDGNPDSEPLYPLMKRYGTVRQVGIKHKIALLSDGKLYDHKEYQFERTRQAEPRPFRETYIDINENPGLEGILNRIPHELVKEIMRVFQRNGQGPMIFSNIQLDSQKAKDITLLWEALEKNWRKKQQGLT
jgi:hypothetical protein